MYLGTGNVASASANDSSFQIQSTSDIISPLGVYNTKVESGELRFDEYQLSIVKRLDDLHRTLENYQPPSESLFSKVILFIIIVPSYLHND